MYLSLRLRQSRWVWRLLLKYADSTLDRKSPKIDNVGGAKGHLLVISAGPYLQVSGCQPQSAKRKSSS